MNNIIITSLSIFLVLVIFRLKSVSSVSINIDSNLQTISCLADKLASSATKIISLQLTSPENSLTVSMDEHSKIFVDDPHLFVKENEGKLEIEMSKSYLTINMTDILASSQSGKYTCVIYYQEMGGTFNHQMESGRLNITIKDVYAELEKLRVKVVPLEKEVKRLTAKDLQHKKEWEKHRQVFKVLKEEVVVLEEASKIQRQYTTDIQEKGQVCAFSSYYEPTTTLRVGSVLTFIYEVIDQCNAYNVSSGVFTAPHAGLYRFSMTFTTGWFENMIAVRIFVNKEDVGQLYAKDDTNYGDQTSMTLLLPLSKGDEVKPKIVDFRTYNYNKYRKYSVFSGYRIPAL